MKAFQSLQYGALPWYPFPEQSHLRIVRICHNQNFLQTDTDLKKRVPDVFLSIITKMLLLHQGLMELEQPYHASPTFIVLHRVREEWKQYSKFNAFGFGRTFNSLFVWKKHERDYYWFLLQGSCHMTYRFHHRCLYYFYFCSSSYSSCSYLHSSYYLHLLHPSQHTYHRHL